MRRKVTDMEGKRKRESSRKGPCLRGNPRIFRVSPLCGGKDRHSKVCTIKGLRDRRIRLSAPTAVQLYDLQSKLGLTQPSKVIDWLIHVTRFEIDKLPPLLFPQVCHLMPQTEENQRLLSPLHNHATSSSSSSVFIQISNSMDDDNCCHFEPSSSSSSFSFPFVEANPTSFSSPSARLMFRPSLTMPAGVSPYLPNNHGSQG